MVKCDVLLLAVSIFMAGIEVPTAPVSGRASRIEPPVQSHDDHSTDSAIPIHRVILMFEPVKDLYDPVVIGIHNKTLEQNRDRKRKRSLPRPKLPGEDTDTPSFTLPGKVLRKRPADPADSLNAEQLVALSDFYLKDAITDRITSKFKITVIDAKEVNAAMNELHISSNQLPGPQDAQRLCTKLRCDAVVDIGKPQLTTSEGVTRDLIIRADVRIAALTDPNGGFMPPHKPDTARIGGSHTKPQVDYTAAGSASANRSFIGAGYGATYASLSEKAAIQAGAIALHTLSTGEQPPLLTSRTKVAIAPAFGPDRADLLVFSRSGRHTVAGAVKQLPTNVAEYFGPDLMPVMNPNIVNASATARAMRTNSTAAAALWLDKYKPDIDVVRKLGSKLNVQYMLLARITDVEVSMAPSGNAAVSENGLDQESPVLSNVQPNVQPWEREAHSEACGALIRVSDGEVVWTDRGETTFTSREKVPVASREIANRAIAIEAEKFALIDLKRRFAAFRSQYEQ